MIYRRLGLGAVLLVSMAIFTVPGGSAQAPAKGVIEFTATVKPTGGRPEPVRQMSFYLLRRSLAEIRKEAEQAEHPTDMDHFIEGLAVSQQLKDWMEKNHTVEFVGPAFTKLVTADDIVNIPEFFDAYTTQNGSSLGGGPPIPAYKEKDKEKNPEKYKRAHDQYRKLLRQYVAANPDTVQGLDVELADGNVAADVRTTQAKQPVAAHLAEQDTRAPPRAASKPKKPPEGQGSLFE